MSVSGRPHWTQAVSDQVSILEVTTPSHRPDSGAGEPAGLVGSRVAVGHHGVTRSALDAARRRAESGAQGRRLSSNACQNCPFSRSRPQLHSATIGRVASCALCGGRAPDLDCGWRLCPRFCRTCTRGMRKTQLAPEGFQVDVLRCQSCGRTTVAHRSLRAPCETCWPVVWAVYGSKLYEEDADFALRIVDRYVNWFAAAGFEYVGRRVHVVPKRAPVSRVWVRHIDCGRVMPKVTPYPRDPRCPWCEDLPDRSLSAIGHLPAVLYLLEWPGGRTRFLKVGIGLSDRGRVASQLRAGFRVIEVREATLLECRRAEQRLLEDLRAWRSRPRVALRLAGDTECLRSSAPIGKLKDWFEPGVRSRDVTRHFA